jgi:hypothetical protein
LQNKKAYAREVHFMDNRLSIQLADEREISVPLAWFPRLQNTTDEQRNAWELIGSGVGIHWQEIDEDISVAGLLGLPED